MSKALRHSFAITKEAKLKRKASLSLGGGGYYNFLGSLCQKGQVFHSNVMGVEKNDSNGRLR